MAQFLANQADLKRAVDGTVRCAGSVHQIMTATETNLTALTSSPQYQGQQQVAFVQAHHKAQEVGARLQKDLDMLQQLLAHASRTYTSNDADVAQNMVHLAGMDPVDMGSSGAGGGGLGGGGLGSGAGGLGITSVGAGSQNI